MKRSETTNEYTTLDRESTILKEKHLAKKKGFVSLPKRLDRLQVVVLNGWRAKGKITHVRLYGDSMSPFIISGNYMIVHHDIDDLRNGDIIVRKAGDGSGWIAHRIIHIQADNGPTIWTKGDMASCLDRKQVGTERILGKVFEVEKNIGDISVRMKCRGLTSVVLRNLSLVQGILYHVGVACNEKDSLPTNVSHLSAYIRFLPKSVSKYFVDLLKIAIYWVSHISSMYTCLIKTHLQKDKNK